MGLADMDPEMNIQRYIFLYTTVSQCVGFFPFVWKNCFNFAGREGSKCHPLWGLWFQGTSLPIACVCGEQRVCVCTAINLPKPSQRLLPPSSAAERLSDVLSYWVKLESVPTQSPKAWKIRCQMQGGEEIHQHSTQGRGAQPEHRACRPCPGGPRRGRDGWDKALPEMCPCWQQVRSVWGNTFSQGIPTQLPALLPLPALRWISLGAAGTDFTALWLTLHRGEWEQQSFMTHCIV